MKFLELQRVAEYLRYIFCLSCDDGTNLEDVLKTMQAEEHHLTCSCQLSETCWHVRYDSQKTISHCLRVIEELISRSTSEDPYVIEEFMLMVLNDLKRFYRTAVRSEEPMECRVREELRHLAEKRDSPVGSPITLASEGDFRSHERVLDQRSSPTPPYSH